MPYKTPNGPIYDSGEFEQILEKAQALADWKGFRGAPQGLGAERKAARHWYRLLSRSRRRHSRRNRRSAVRAGRQGGVAHRRSGDGTGTSVDIRAVGGTEARHRSAGRAARPGRQRRSAGRHAECCIAFDHDGGQRHRRLPATKQSKKAGEAQRKFSRPMLPMSISPTVHSGLSEPTARFRFSILRLACARPQCRRTCRAGSTASRNLYPRR